MAQMVKSLPCNTGDLGLIPGLGSSPRGGHGNPFQYSCLENPMDRGAWWAIVYGVAKELGTTEMTQQAQGYNKYRDYTHYLVVTYNGI